MFPKRSWILIAGFVGALAGSAVAVERPEVTVPTFGDKYSLTVTKLEAGDTGIDYKEFRESFLASKQFQVAASRRNDLDRLRSSLRKLVAQSKTSEVVRAAKGMLSIDYTDMEAHKLLRQAYQLLGDEANARKYHDIEFGLLNSIVHNGDGKTCASAWPVVQVREEYFVLGMLGATVKQQSIDRQGGLCDRMDVTIDGKDATYYFGVAKVFESYGKELGK